MNKIQKAIELFRTTLWYMDYKGLGLRELTEKDFLLYCPKDSKIKRAYSECGFESLKRLIINAGKESSLEYVLEKAQALIVLSEVQNKVGDSFTLTDVKRVIKRVEDIEPILRGAEKNKVIGRKSKCRYFFTGSKKKTREMLCSIPKEELKDESFTDADLSETYRLSLEEEVKKYKRFVVTTAVACKPVYEDFMKSIENYAERMNALVLVLPSDIKNSNNDKDLMEDQESSIVLDPRLKKFRVVFKDLYLNKNLCVCTIKTSAKQINTLTGLERVAAKKDASIIVASTKHFLKNVPNRHYDIPKKLVTTGALTLADYDTDKYMSKRTAYLAENDHMYGAAIVEVVDESIFHIRQTKASKYGSFTDLGLEFMPNGKVMTLEHSVLVEGDSHTDGIDQELHEATMQFANDMNVDTIVLHDVFNASSVTHHDKGKNITRAIKAMQHRLSLEDECKYLKRYLEVVKSNADEVVIVNSNHNRHLDDYLEHGRYVEDPINSHLGHKLALAMIEGKAPLKYMITEELGLKDQGIKWLDEDESYVKYGIELGIHGDRGANGGKGNLSVFEKGVWNCVTAHTHAAQVVRESMSVGTIAKMDQGYNKGFSSWTRTCCICYENGVKQLIDFIKDKNGKYTWTINQ